MPIPPDCDTTTESPSLQFSHVECLLYTYHSLMRMASKTTAVIEESMQGEALKDFRVRLQYFARGVQAYIKILKDALKVCCIFWTIINNKNRHNAISIYLNKIVIIFT